MTHIDNEYHYIWVLLKDVIKQLVKEYKHIDNYNGCNCKGCIQHNMENTSLFIHELRIQAVFINLKILCRRFLIDITAADNLIALLFKTIAYSIKEDSTFSIFQLVVQQLLNEILEYLYRCVKIVKDHLKQLLYDNPGHYYEIIKIYPFVSLYSPNDGYIVNRPSIVNPVANRSLIIKDRRLEIDPYCYVSIRIYREVIMPLYGLICQNIYKYNSARTVYSIFAAGLCKWFILYGYHPVINPIPKCTIDPNLVVRLLRHYDSQKIHSKSLFLLLTKSDMYEFCKLCIHEHDLKSINIGINLYSILHKDPLVDSKLFYKAASIRLGTRFIVELLRIGCTRRISYLKILGRGVIVKKKRGQLITFPDFQISKRCYIPYMELYNVWYYIKLVIRYHIRHVYKRVLNEWDYKMISNYNKKINKINN